jgi:hypothetical protein
MRVVRTRVLPLPAPAKISADWCGKVTASSCLLFRPVSKESMLALSHGCDWLRLASKQLLTKILQKKRTSRKHLSQNLHDNKMIVLLSFRFFPP